MKSAAALDKNGIGIKKMSWYKRGIHRNTKKGFAPVQTKTTGTTLRLNDGKGSTKITN